MAKTKHQGNGRKHATETPDVSHVRNVDVTHEMSDVNVPAILKFVLGLVVMTIGVYLLMLLLFSIFNAKETKKDETTPAGPMAMSEQESLPPEPRLQSAPGFGVKLENGQWVPLEKTEPQAEYKVLRDQWNSVLKEGSKDQSGKTIGLPIEQAMKNVLAGQGLPVRPQESGPDKTQDQLISVPSAASSGRVSMKGEQ
jgi:hypothetical protein